MPLRLAREGTIFIYPEKQGEGMVSKVSGGFYEYYLKNHLGNGWITFQLNSSAMTVKQATEYYAFGMNSKHYTCQVLKT